MISPNSFLYILYGIFGLLIMIFHSSISKFFYKLSLLFTDKLKLDNLMLYKVDESNKNILLRIAKRITFFLGAMILLIAIGLYFY